MMRIQPPSEPGARTRAPAALVALACVLMLAGCAGINPPPAGPTAAPQPATPPPQEPPEEPSETPPPTPAPAPDPAPPPPADPAPEVPASLRYVHGAEFRAATLQTYRWAQHEVERLAGVLERGAWAVALDVDETVLSNAPYQQERAALGLGFSRPSWNAWVERRAAVPLSGATEFLERVHELGGVVALVTNRAEDLCAATEDNLRAQGVPYDVILCRPPVSGGGEKEPRWDSLRDGTAAAGLGPVEIVMYVGDNIQDFPDLDQGLRNAPDDAFDAFGEVYFVIPNPMYGSWQQNPL